MPPNRDDYWLFRLTCGRHATPSPDRAEPQRCKRHAKGKSIQPRTNISRSIFLIAGLCLSAALRDLGHPSRLDLRNDDRDTLLHRTDLTDRAGSASRDLRVVISATRCRRWCSWPGRSPVAAT